MNLPAFREALKVLRGATMHTDGKAFMEGVEEILAQRDKLLEACDLIELAQRHGFDVKMIENAAKRELADQAAPRIEPRGELSEEDLEKPVVDAAAGAAQVVSTATVRTVEMAITEAGAGLLAQGLVARLVEPRGVGSNGSASDDVALPKLGDTMQLKEEDISPKFAAELLETSYGNRPINQSVRS